MSATNRGSKRMVQDKYPTPLAAFVPLLPFLPTRGPIWEPACGDGRLITAMRQHGLQADGDDLLNGYDFLADRRRRFAVVTNPPFSAGLAFCQHAVELADHVYLLLRLNFLASRKRHQWFRKHEPDSLFVLSQRPSFVNGRTDACDYAWFYWGSSWRGIRHF